MPPVQLAIPLALLVGAAIAATTGPSRTETLLATTRAWTGEHYAQYLDGQPEMRMLRISIEPGATLPWHRNTVPNAGYLLEGELHIETREGASLVLRPGDSIAQSVDVVQRGIAGPEGATILMFYANVEGKAVTVVEA
jgi:quercetin dioxygenase-like cupin family protein